MDKQPFWRTAKKITTQEEPVLSEVIRDFLWLGNRSVSKSYTILSDNHITHVLTVTQSNQIFPNLAEKWYKHHKRIEIPNNAGDVSAHFEEAFEFIQNCHVENGKIVVCGLDDASLALTVVLAYLMKTWKISFPEALAVVNKRRAPTLVLPQQSVYPHLLSYQQSLNHLFELRLDSKNTSALNPEDTPAVAAAAAFPTGPPSLPVAAVAVSKSYGGPLPEDGKNEKKYHVVIVGAGFAGCFLAIRFQKKRRFYVTLIDAKGYFEFTPGIVKIIAGNEDEDENILVPIEEIVRYGEAITAKVKEVDSEKVTLHNGRLVKFDFLCICTGCTYDCSSTIHSPLTESSTESKNIQKVFDTIKSNEVEYKHFSEFCRRSYSAESVAFIDEVDKYFSVYKKLVSCNKLIQNRERDGKGEIDGDRDLDTEPPEMETSEYIIPAVTAVMGKRRNNQKSPSPKTIPKNFFIRRKKVLVIFQSLMKNVKKSRNHPLRKNHSDVSKHP